MKRLIQGFALACLVLATGAAQAGEGKWVSKSGNVHASQGGNAVFVSDEDAERFNLTELADGETRTFGSGARAVIVSRSGNEATITRAGAGDDVSAIEITCQLDDDTCTVLTFPDEPEKVMVAIEKERVCTDGEGDCDFAFGEAHGEGHVIVDIDCDGDDCSEIQTLHLNGLAELDEAFTVETAGVGDEPSRIVIRRVGGGDVDAQADNVFVTKVGASAIGGMHRMHALHGDSVMLQCTEGDATIMVEKGEAEDTFLCPKHSTPMEPVKGLGSGVHVIRTAEPREH